MAYSSFRAHVKAQFQMLDLNVSVKQSDFNHCLKTVLFQKRV